MKNESRIYWTSVEFTLKSTHKDFGEVKGGFVYAFVKSIDEKEAHNKFAAELDSHQLIPTEFEYIEPYEDIEWGNYNDEKYYKSLVEETNSSMNVILDDFYMYENIE